MANLCLFGLISKHPGRNRGGAGISLGRLAEFFVAQGHRVDIVMARPAGDVHPLSYLAPTVHFHFVDRPHKLSIFLHLLRVVVVHPPDALLAFDTRANQIGSWLKLIPGLRTRVWMSLRNALAEKHRGLLQRAAARSDGVIAISHGLAEQFLALTTTPPAKVHVIYNPAVPPALAELASRPVEHPWLAAGQPPLILAAGRLTTQKDFPTLLHAFATLRRGRSAHLMILGEGELLEELQQLAVALDVADDVHFAGFQQNPWRFMRHAAVFVLSSAWEGFGNVLAEALSLAVPSVSTDCPHGPREILQGGRLGQLVPVGDADELAKAIGATLDHPMPKEQLIAGAQPFAQQVAGSRHLDLLLPESSG